MKFCIVGAGAIGGLLGFQLARTGNDVSIVARGAHLDAIQTQGLTLVNHLDGGRSETLPMVADADPAVLADKVGIQDVIFLGLKAHAIPAMLGRLEPLIGPDTIVIPAINGVPWWYFQCEGSRHDGAVVKSVDPVGDMHAILSADHVVGCVVHAAGEVRAPGEVHYTGGKRFFIGEIDRGLKEVASARVTRVASLMNDAGFEVLVSNDIRIEVWAKLIGNLSFNPVAALANALMNQICADEGLLSIIRPMLVEGMAVARQFGVEVKMTPDERINIARHLGSAKISMHQDFEAHRRPEIDAVVGAVIELAGWVNVPVPTIRMVDALVRARATNLGLL